MLPSESGELKENDRCKVLKSAKSPTTNSNTFIWPNESVTVDDDAIIFFSSGTTGPPKAVVLSQKSLNAYLTLLKYDILMSQKRQLRIHSSTLQSDPNSNFVTLSNTDTVFGVLPYFHAGGLLTTFIMLAQGAKVLINRRFTEDEFLGNISKYEVRFRFARLQNANIQVSGFRVIIGSSDP